MMMMMMMMMKPSRTLPRFSPDATHASQTCCICSGVMIALSYSQRFQRSSRVLMAGRAARRFLSDETPKRGWIPRIQIKVRSHHLIIAQQKVEFGPRTRKPEAGKEPHKEPPKEPHKGDGELHAVRHSSPTQSLQTSLMPYHGPTLLSPLPLFVFNSLSSPQSDQYFGIQMITERPRPFKQLSWQEFYTTMLAAGEVGPPDATPL